MNRLCTGALLLALLLSAHNVLGQSTPNSDDQTIIRKGSIGLGGVANIWADGSPGNTWSQGNVAPSASFFIRDNLALVTSLLYFGSRQASSFQNSSFTGVDGMGNPIFFTYPSERVNTTMRLGAQVGINYYRWIGKRFAIVGFMGLSGGFLRNTQSLTPPPFPTSAPWSGAANGFFLQATLSPSLVYALSERWLLTASFGSLFFSYNEVNQAEEFRQNSSLWALSGSVNSSFQASLSSGLSLGFTYFLRRR